MPVLLGAHVPRRRRAISHATTTPIVKWSVSPNHAAEHWAKLKARRCHTAMSLCHRDARLAFSKLTGLMNASVRAGDLAFRISRPYCEGKLTRQLGAARIPSYRH